MRFDNLEIEGAFAITAKPVVDERGDFDRTFCAREFAEWGLVHHFVQHSISRSVKRGTIRGLHFQAAPYSETKLVRYLHGAVFDVIIDLCLASPTFGRWLVIELSTTKCNAFYIPEGGAHGFQTLADTCELEYLTAPEYVPSAARGIRWDDPIIAIDWPIKTGVILSERDDQWPSIDAVGIRS